MKSGKILGDVTLQQSIFFRAGCEAEFYEVYVMSCCLETRGRCPGGCVPCPVISGTRVTYQRPVSVRWRSLYNIYFLHRFCSTNQYLWWIAEECSENIINILSYFADQYRPVIPWTTDSKRWKRYCEQGSNESTYTGNQGHFWGVSATWELALFIVTQLVAVVISRVMFHY